MTLDSALFQSLVEVSGYELRGGLGVAISCTL